MPTVGTFEELATGTGTTRGFSRTLRGVIQRRPAHLLLSEVMGVAIGNLAKVIYLGVIPSPLDLFGLYVHKTLPVANGLYAYGSSHPWNVHSLLRPHRPDERKQTLRLLQIHSIFVIGRDPSKTDRLVAPSKTSLPVPIPPKVAVLPYLVVLPRTSCTV
jgi:hypothetical protein